MYLLLPVLALCYLCLFLLALRKVVGSGSEFKFIYGWGFVIGAFVWEDVVVFAPLFMFITILALLMADFRVWILCFLVFWIVRSLGETIYFFLEQFLEPKTLPHNIERHLEAVERMFGGIDTQKAFILMQVMFQTVTISASVALVLLLMHWQSLPSWA